MVDVNKYMNSESKYLKAADLTPGTNFRLTIKGISETEFNKDDGSKQIKLTLAFNQTEKLWAMPKVSIGAISHVYGTETDSWAGRDILVYSTTVPFGEKMVPAVRCDVPRQEGTMQQNHIEAEMQSNAPPDAAPIPSPDNNFTGEFPDDDLPF